MLINCCSCLFHILFPFFSQHLPAAIWAPARIQGWSEKGLGRISCISPRVWAGCGQPTSTKRTAASTWWVQPRISLRVLRGLVILMPLVIFSGVPSELGGGDIPLPHDGCRQSLGFDNAIVTRCQMNWNWCCFMGLLCHKSLDQAPILYHRRCHSELGWIKRKQCIWNVL